MVRNSNIDAVKGLGIVLVVFGHNWFVDHAHGALFRVIFSFHMPLFFFLAGIFLNENTGTRKALHSKSASLLKPYFVTLISLGAAKLIVAGITGRTEFDAATYFAGVFWSSGLMLPWPQMWFLTNLFLSTMLALLVLKLWRRLGWSTRSQLGATFAILFAGIYAIGLFWNPSTHTAATLLDGFYPGLPWGIDLLPVTCSFVLLGFLLRDQAKSDTHNLPLVFAAACVFALMHFLFKHTIDLNLREFRQPLIGTAEALLGIYLVFGAAALLRKFGPLHSLVSYLGSASLFILIFHFFIQGTAFNKLAAINGVRPELAAGVALVLGIAVPVLLWELTRRQRHLALLMLPASRPPIATAQ